MLEQEWGLQGCKDYIDRTSDDSDDGLPRAKSKSLLRVK